MLSRVTQEQLISAETLANSETYFSGLSSDLIINYYKDQDRIANGRRHSEEVKKFAMTLYFSPLVRVTMSNPFLHLGIFCRWLFFFIDDFKQLQLKVKSNSINPKCALI